MSEPLTKAERQLMQLIVDMDRQGRTASCLPRYVCRNRLNGEVAEGLAGRGLVEYEPREGMDRIHLTHAGHEALIEGAVAEKFAELDATRNDRHPVSGLNELIEIARDQERRLARLEMRT